MPMSSWHEKLYPIALQISAAARKRAIQFDVNCFCWDSVARLKISYIVLRVRPLQVCFRKRIKWVANSLIELNLNVWMSSKP